MWINKARYFSIIARDAFNAERDTMILELRRQITDLNDRLRLALERQDREQQRADTALSLAARVKTGQDPASPPVTPSLPKIAPHQEAPAEVESIRQDIRSRGATEVMRSSRWVDSRSTRRVLR